MRVKHCLTAFGIALTAVLLTDRRDAGFTCHAEPPLAQPAQVGGTGVPPVGPRGSGAPPRVACYAQPSTTKSNCGYYVGGGSAWCRGQPRCVRDGTWGWDYHGCVIPQRVFLQWHPGRYQGGSGSYKIDGLKLLKLGTHVHEHDTP